MLKKKNKGDYYITFTDKIYSEKGSSIENPAK